MDLITRCVVFDGVMSPARYSPKNLIITFLLGEV